MTIDPTNPPEEIQAHERARDQILEISPPDDPVEKQVVEDWLNGNFDYSQTNAYNELVEVIYAKEMQDKEGTN